MTVEKGENMKTYVFYVNTDEDSTESFKKINFDLDLSNAMVHIVNLVEIKIYNSDMVPYVYPNEEQYPAIEQGTLLILDGLGKSLGIPKNRLITKCFFTSDHKEKSVEYLKEVNANLVVSATRGKSGLAGFFSSSFTEYLCKFSPCDILVLRPVKK